MNAAARDRSHRPVCACCESPEHYWVLLRRRLPPKRFWWRWNLAHTKAVLAEHPSSPSAKALLALWSPRIKRALILRYPLAADGGAGV